MLRPEDSLAALATRIPSASRVFMRHSLDFCCGGRRSVADACAERGLDPRAILDEIAAAPDDGRASWQDRPLAELIDHIIETHHRPLDEELPRLAAMAKKVFAVHADKDPERLAALAAVVQRVADDLAQHMHKEESVLFPWIVNGHGRTAGQPVRVLMSEHDDTAKDLARIRELTDDFVPPRGACATWRALWLGLEALDADLRTHIHLENNVLFPRALAQ